MSTNIMQAVACAIADLEGILPEIDPSGDREHPAWRTLEELREAARHYQDEIARLIDELGRIYAIARNEDEIFINESDEAKLEEIGSIALDAVAPQHTRKGGAA